MKTSNPKVTKGQLTKAVDHFFWRVSYVTGGTSLENARQVETMIPELERHAQEIAFMLEDAGKLALADSHLIDRARNQIPSKLANYKARLGPARTLLAKHAQGTAESPSACNVVTFPASPQEAIPSPLEIMDAIATLSRVQPELLAKFMPKKN